MELLPLKHIGHKSGYLWCFACPDRLPLLVVPFESQHEYVREYWAIVCQRQNKLNRANEQHYWITRFDHMEAYMYMYYGQYNNSSACFQVEFMETVNFLWNNWVEFFSFCTCTLASRATTSFGIPLGIGLVGSHVGSQQTLLLPG